MCKVQSDVSKQNNLKIQYLQYYGPAATVSLFIVCHLLTSDAKHKEAC